MIRRELRYRALLGSVGPTFPAGMNLWLRADMGITLAGTDVSAWLDQSVSANNLVQAVAINRPAFIAADPAYGNQPVVNSTNATQWLTAAAGAIIAQPLSIFVVGERTTVGGTGVATGSSVDPTPPILFSTFGQINAGVNLNSGILANVPGVILGEFNGAISRSAVSNWRAGGTIGNAGASPTVRWSVGAYTNGLFGTIGKIAEVIAYPRILSTAEKAVLAAYFTSRYGLAIT